MAESSLPVQPFKDTDRHPRRVRWTAHVADALMVIFAALGAAWLFFRLLLCSGELEQYACSQSYAVPSLMAGMLLVAIALILYFLKLFGHELEQTGRVETSPRSFLRRVGYHIQHGYRHLDEQHRKHVRRSVFWVGTAGAVVTATLLFFWIAALPPLLAILIGVAGMLATYLANQRWL